MCMCVCEGMICLTPTCADSKFDVLVSSVILIHETTHAINKLQKHTVQTSEQSTETARCHKLLLWYYLHLPHPSLPVGQY